MANKFAISSGNFNNAAIWSLSATGLSATTVPTIGDNAYANSYTVSITGDVLCSTLNNGTSSSAVEGGYFLIDASTVSSNVSATIGWSCARYTNVMVLTGSQNISINGNIYGGANLIALSAFSPIGINSYCANNTVTITGNIYLGSPAYTYGYANTFIINSTSNSTYNITGNLYQYSRNSQVGSGSSVLRNLGPSTINLQGDIIANAGNVGGDRVIYSQSGTITHVGTIYGSANGIGQSNVDIVGGIYTLTTPFLYSYNTPQYVGTFSLITNAGGTVNVNAGTIQGGSIGNNNAFYAVGTTAGTTTIVAGNILAGTKLQAIYASGGTTRIYCSNISTEFNGIPSVTSSGGSLSISSNITNSQNGTAAVYAASYTVNPIPYQTYIRYANNGTGVGSDAYLYHYTTDSLSAFSIPPVSAVRAGVQYADNTLTGTCQMPAASAVTFGALVDNTSGTAAITNNTLFDVSVASLTATDSLGARLKNSATVESVGRIIASFSN